MIKKQILSLIFLLLNLSVIAQIDEGNYEGFKIVKGDRQPDIITIRVLSLGNGTTQFSELKNKKPLQGGYHIIINRRKYFVGNFIKGIPNGDWEEFRDNELIEKGTYKNGKYDGKVLTYKTWGADHSIYTMKEGVVQHSISYFSNGQVESERFYDENGRLNGQIITYDKDGNIRTERNYLHGQYHGKQKEYETSGYSTFSEYSYGKQVGDYCRLYPNGNVSEKGSYDENSKKTGKWIYGEENGDIKVEEQYLNGKSHGERRCYYEGGVLRSIEQYAEGKLNGKRIDYDEDPNVVSNEGEYVDNQRHGGYKVYHKGILWRESVYNRGRVVSEKEYQDGKLRILRLIDENGSLVNVNQYDNSGKRTYNNTNYKKHSSIKLKEDASGIVDVEIE